MDSIVARVACLITAQLVLSSCFSEAGGGGDDDTPTATAGGGTMGASEASTSSTDPSMPGTGSASVTGETLESDTTAGESESESTAGVEPMSFCRDVEATLTEPSSACNDFEDSGYEHGNWTLPQADGGIAEVTAAPGAPERGSVASTSFAAIGGTNPEAYVALQPGDVTLLTQLQFRMEVGTCGGEVVFAAMSFPDDALTVGLVLGEDGGVALEILDVIGNGNRYPLDAGLVAEAGPWAKWEIRVDLDSAYVNVLVNDEIVRAVKRIAVPTPVTSAAEIRLGVSRKAGGFECGFAFDDILRY